MTRKEFFLTFIAAPFVKPLAKLIPPPMEAVVAYPKDRLDGSLNDFFVMESGRIQKAMYEQMKKRGRMSALISKGEFPIYAHQDNQGNIIDWA